MLHNCIHARARNLAQNSDFAYANVSTKTLQNLPKFPLPNVGQKYILV
nr:hypothetical protein [Campylobacter troglodytis]